MKTRVVFSKKHKHDVYIGRGSGNGPWGNPYGHRPGARFKVDTAEEAVRLYEDWIRARPELVERARRELHGRVLGCPCGGRPCHGEVLAKIADEAPAKRIASLVKSKVDDRPSAAKLLEDAIAKAGYDPRKNGARCDLCPLAGSVIVPPNGTYEDRKPRLAIVGEGPGRKEELQGRAFVGMTGQYLNGLLRVAGIDRREAVIQNASLCRGERDKDNELAAVCCAPRLLRELRDLPKKVPIIVLGKTAALTVLGIKSIMHSRGFVWTTREIDKPHVDAGWRAVAKAKEKKQSKENIDKLSLKAAIVEGRSLIAGRTVFPTVHPAFVLRSDTWAPILEADLDRAGRWIRGELRYSDLLDFEPKFDLVRRPREIERALRKLGDVVAVDIETRGVDPLQAPILCVGISDGSHTVVIVHPSAKEDEPAPTWDIANQAPVLSRFLKRCKIIGMHNGYNFDQIALRRDGVIIPEEKIEDTLIGHHAFASHLPQRLAHVASVYCDIGPWKITFKRGKGDAEKGLPPDKLPMGELVMYNSCDAVIQARTWLAMQADLTVEQAVYAHDKELAAICREMQIDGIKMDIERRNMLVKMIKSKAAALKGRMRKIAKMPDLHPMRLGEIRYALFTRLRAPMMEPTESGDPSTSSKTLEALKTKSDTRYGQFAGTLLNWRTAVKIRATYCDAITLWHGDRFHPNWKPYGTVSGRLSCRFQSTPRAEVSEEAKAFLKKHPDQKIDKLIERWGINRVYDVETRVREMWIPEQGCAFLYFDGSQAEMRFAAHLSGDKNFIETCKGDVHTGNARILFPDEQVLWTDPKGAGKPYRDVAKNAGFGVTYLAEAETVFQFLLSKGFAVTLPKVVAMLDRMRAGYPDYFKYVARNVEWCAKHGYMRTPLVGRIRWLGWHSPPTEVANCLDAETEALTPYGWVRGFDLKPGDKLLTKNAKTGAMTWEPIARLKLFPKYRGDVYEFKSRSFNAVTTPAHRWLVTDRRERTTRCALTEELAKGLGDLSIHRTGEYVAPTAAIYTDAFVELVGWILTDGSVSKPGVPQKITVYQSERGNAAKVKRIDSLFKRLDTKPTRDKVGRGGIAWRLYGASSLTQAICELFPQRTLSQAFLFRLTGSQLQLLLNTMMAGDGTHSRDKSAFCCRDKDRADVFQTLATLCGFATTARWRPPQKVKRQYASIANRPQSKGIWLVTLLRNTTAQVIVHPKRYGKCTKRVNQVRKLKSKTGVWCPVVPNTYFVARRKGDVYVTGNTPIQSGIADIMNLRTIKARKYLPPGVRLVAQIHDACIYEVPHAHVETMKKILTDIWAEPIKLAVEFVLPIEMKEGDRWSYFG